MCFAKEVYLTSDELSVLEKISDLYGVPFSSNQEPWYRLSYE